jgi:DNA invertase Pin-like site-specific DNA recombinase
MACVIYCRQSDTTNDKRSREDGETLSLEAQITACREHAGKMAWPVLSVYAEQFSGLADVRPAYQRMLAEIKRNLKAHPPGDPGRISQIVVYKYLRLSRDPIHTVPLVGYFRQQGIEIEPVKDLKVGGTPLDELMLYAVRTFGKIQVQDSIQHAKDAREALLVEGKLVCAGKARYGYRYDKKARARVIDPEQAEVVRKIFGWFRQGHSTHKVMFLLQDAGIPSPQGKPRWALKTIRNVVRDPSYKGAPMRVGKTERTEGYFPSGVRKFRELKGAHREVGEATPAIVAGEVWERANELARSRSKDNFQPGADWLVGCVYCRSCGTRLSRFWHTTHKH